MIILWGFRKMQKLFGQSGPYTCNNCHNHTLFEIIRVRNWFTLFFIPLFPVSGKYYNLCPVCRQGYELTKQQAQELVNQERIEAQSTEIH